MGFYSEDEISAVTEEADRPQVTKMRYSPRESVKRKVRARGRHSYPKTGYWFLTPADKIAMLLVIPVSVAFGLFLGFALAGIL